MLRYGERNTGNQQVAGTDFHHAFTARKGPDEPEWNDGAKNGS